MVSAVGCGSADHCTASSCSQLAVAPPADGGTCAVVVTFDDGSSASVSFDWGDVHPNPCCGPTYDSPGGTIVVHGDAGDGG